MTDANTIKMGQTNTDDSDDTDGDVEKRKKEVK
jgi:hypothetical protein